MKGWKKTVGGSFRRHLFGERLSVWEANGRWWAALGEGASVSGKTPESAARKLIVKVLAKVDREREKLAALLKQP